MVHAMANILDLFEELVENDLASMSPFE